MFVSVCSLFFGGGLQLGKKAAPLQSQTGESVDRKGAQRGRQEKKQKKVLRNQKTFLPLQTQTGNGSGSVAGHTGKFRERRGRRLCLAVLEGGRKK